MRRVQPGGDFISLADYLADPANHRPRSSGGTAAAARTKDGADEAVGTGDDEALSVFDDVTGAVRVMSSRCGTCIGRAGNAAGLTDRRRDVLLGRRDDGTYDEGHTVCHSSLPGNAYDLPPAVCAWIAEHPQAAPRSHGMRMAASFGIQYMARPPGSRRQIRRRPPDRVSADRARTGRTRWGTGSRSSCSRPGTSTAA
ncbi:hypothetical protein [Streptomyces sp. NPDC051662]|uniref:hypothetical protein n=1 Tax=Streptomyces sp. NPDC051662 TaxID=3154750 RepID=UPI0034490B26